MNDYALLLVVIRIELLPFGTHNMAIINMVDESIFKNRLLKASYPFRIKLFHLQNRLASIDCPERKQPYSAVATKFISDAIFSRQVSVVVDSKDRYGRSIGWVYYDGKNSTKSF